MNEQERFAVWIAGATLRADNREVDALALNGLAQQAEESGDLKHELEEMRNVSRSGGDFGAEIVGAIVIPILIEAGKQLWAVYLKKLADKAAGDLANATVDAVKTFAKQQWSSSGVEARTEYEAIIRSESAKQGLSREQTDGLLAALQHPSLPHEIANG